MAKRGVIANLSINLSVGTAKLRKGFKTARMKVAGFGKAIRRAIFSLRGFAAAALAAVGVAGLGAFIKGQMQAIDAIGKTSAKLGIATGQLAALHHAAALSGISVNTFNMSLQRMVRRLAEAAVGTGEAQTALKDLHLDAGQLAAMSPDNQLRAIADAMKGIKTQGDRVRLAMKLFDSEGVAMVLMLQEGSEALDEMTKEAFKLGIALNEIDVKQVEMANDSITSLKQVFVGLGRQIAVAIAPLVVALNEQLIEVGTSGQSAGHKIRNAFGWIFNSIAYLGTITQNVYIAFKQVQILINRLIATIVVSLGQLFDWIEKDLPKCMRTGWGKIGMEIGKDLHSDLDGMQHDLDKMIQAPTWGQAFLKSIDEAGTKVKQVVAEAGKFPDAAEVPSMKRAGPAAALQRGTAAAYSAIMRAGRNDPVVRALDQQKPLLEENNRLLGDIGQILWGPDIVLVPIKA